MRRSSAGETSDAPGPGASRIPSAVAGVPPAVAGMTDSDSIWRPSQESELRSANESVLDSVVAIAPVLVDPRSSTLSARVRTPIAVRTIRLARNDDTKIERIRQRCSAERVKAIRMASLAITHSSPS